MPSSGDGAASVSLRRSLLKSLSSGRTGKAALALQVLGVGCLVTAAFFAGRHFAGQSFVLASGSPCSKQMFTPIRNVHSVARTAQPEVPSAGIASRYVYLIAISCPALYCLAAIEDESPGLHCR